jgi:hypothetical protein
MYILAFCSIITLNKNTNMHTQTSQILSITRNDSTRIKMLFDSILVATKNIIRSGHSIIAITKSNDSITITPTYII